MIEFTCECPVAGFCKRHNVTKTNREFTVCQGGPGISPARRMSFIIDWEQRANGEDAPVKKCVGCGPQLPPKNIVVGRPGTELKSMLRWFGQYEAAGCNCVKHAEVMDQRGCAWCEANIDTILGWLTEEAGKRSVAGFSLDKVPGFDASAKMIVGEAIARARQKALLEKTGKAPPPPLFAAPFDPYQVTSHIIYHLMPLSGPSEWIWKQHVAWLKEIRPQFNGRMIVGIVTKSDADEPWEYDPPEKVIEEFGDIAVEFIIDQNHFGREARRGKGEGVTFLKMMEQLETDDPNTIIYYGHGKGVTHPDQPLNSAVHKWAKISFDCLFKEQDIVQTALASHGIVGSFRVRDTNRRLHPGGWHFSGTFFAMRARDVFTRNWRKLKEHYGCVELWPNGIFREYESACIFFDNVPHSRMLYTPDYWNQSVLPAYAQWMDRGVGENEGLTAATVLYNPSPAVVANVNRIILSITHQRHCQVIVIDNSDQRTQGLEGVDLHVWNSGQNNQWGGAINQAVQYATGSLFLHFSARRTKIIDDRWLGRLLAPLALDSCGMAGPLQKVPFKIINEKTPHAGAPEAHIQQSIFAARTEVLRKVPWGSKYPHTYSDVWHSWSLLSNGYDLVDVYEVTSAAGLEPLKPDRMLECGPKLP